MLEVRNLRSGYGATEVLHAVSLTVKAGQSVCIIGANGAGKTTLLRTLAGLIRPTAGRILLAGEEIVALSTSARLARGLALVPEGRRVFAPMTVEENLEMGAFRRLWPRRDRGVAQDLAMVFELFPRLQERRRQAAGLLSGGEQQMLAIGRALMGRPRLLLLDEPSMGLAPRVVQEIFATIRRLNAEGMSILLAEQNANMALRSAAHGYVLAEGEIVRADAGAVLMRDAGVRAAYLGL
ncbi:ABC transporter ATP-binding protein [Xanthobacter dioxanivorans]|uniref:ABC transporter ATP-binding protein n=1 Tax=Xanthobacter dioxanivorans TaxID=2528964 RepID=A0A974PMZ5_9HYPH|nr:ABC transporter ATP-binding protein [Xanthobacter dioxanivorans]QRG06554.1 ABC transporter ATP-binding protein [Xanthobacter dioxanivorans]